MLVSLLAAVAAVSSGGAPAPPAPTAARPVIVITNPDWLRRPSAEDVSRVWPVDGFGVDGRVVLACVVSARGLLDRCEVTSETPPGHGFGGAALLLAGRFEMRPRLVNGAPVGGAAIRIPIMFKGWRTSAPSNMTTIRVVDDLAWREVPTAAEVAAAWPHDSPANVASGRVVLRCHVKMDGTLRDCETTFETPRSHGFGQAALRLSRQFKALTVGPLFETKRDFYVELPFDFRNPNQPAPPVQVVSADWLEAPDPAMAGALFPPEAAKAGFKTGVGVISCEVTHEGRLTGCATVSETPPNLGFGAAALHVAPAMAMNPWTRQGDPVDGARVDVPLRFNLSPDAPAATTAH